MRWIVLFLLLLTSSLFGGYVFLKGYPFRLYSNWVQGKEWNKYYSVDGYKSSWLRPIPVAEISPYKEDYGQLWKEFPLRNSLVPLPVRHPLFQTVPFLESKGKGIPPQVGMIFLNPIGRELSRIYTLPVSLLQDHTLGQDLFKLPFVKNRILKLSQDKVWKDVFIHEIDKKSKSLDEMIYDLYILHLRSKILPKSTLKFGLLKDDRALVELDSKDKDYMIELVFTNSNGSLYSYILRTEINNNESRKLRSKFLESISFSSIDPAMGKFLYTEFKQLNFARQVDQEGMLYLYSAWSQEFENMDMFKEMIFYLERGRNNTAQLRPLYTFAMKHFGKTFTTKSIFNEHDDPNIVLQRKIEIEKIEKMNDALKEKSKPPLQPELSPDEKMNIYLKKAKEESPAEKDDMTIH
jgi:hypothetical protein